MKPPCLLVLWVGAYLVLNGQLTLGQLIAFRIISGYVTSPLLRLVQLWQNFQETALSLERPQRYSRLTPRNRRRTSKYPHAGN
jgi:ATP-binding cassette subfamily B protein